MERSPNRHFVVGAARGFGGAIIFSLPLLMTMEMWSLGFSIPPGRLALLIGVFLPVLVGLSYFSGFEKTARLKHDVVDAFVAIAIGATSSTIILALFAVMGGDDSPRSLIGKVALQTVPASIGALLAQSQLGGSEARAEEQRRETETGTWGEVFLMMIGALFLAFNVAPTEEMILIAYKMSLWHILGLAALSLLVMHAFVFSVEFHGQHDRPGSGSFHAAFFRETVVGYAVALLVSGYALWTFGRFEGDSATMALSSVVVLGFPAAVGAAAARLIL